MKFIDISENEFFEKIKTGNVRPGTIFEAKVETLNKEEALVTIEHPSHRLKNAIYSSIELGGGQRPYLNDRFYENTEKIVTIEILRNGEKEKIKIDDITLSDFEDLTGVVMMMSMPTSVAKRYRRSMGQE